MMINSEKNIYLQETEVKPNHYAGFVMLVLTFGMLFCWGLNEIGIFRVGTREMRIGTAVPLTCVIALLIALRCNTKMPENPSTKYWMFTVGTIVTLSVNTLLMFHTTIMLLFPMFLAMLYRSSRLGILSLCSSVFCTIVSPILSYILHVWDIPLLQELILIGTNETVDIVGDNLTISWLAIGKIVLYLVLPRLIMAGSCAILMFRVIRIGVAHVNNQILLEQINRRDTLTGLYNQNYFKKIVENPQTGRVGILYLDVNGLKKANDTYGHECGDFLLKRCAKSLTDVCDDHTFGFRVGGDEFVLLLEGAEEAEMHRKIAQWDQALANINRENRENAELSGITAGYGNLTCAMACGWIIGDFSDIQNLVHEADVTMYRNKAQMKEKLQKESVAGQ